MAPMTKRERCLRTIRFEETDRVPLYDIIQNDAISEHYGGQPITVENGNWLAGVVHGRVLDMCRMVAGPSAPATFETPDGAVRRTERYTSWIEKRPFTDETMLDWVKQEIQRINQVTFDAAYAEQFHKMVRWRLGTLAEGDPTGRNDPAVFVLESGAGLDPMYTVLDLPRFTYLMIDEPGLVEEWLEAKNQCEIRRVEAIADPELIPVALTYDDIAYKGGLLLPLEWLQEHWIPRLKRLVDAWHARGAYCLFHSDGDLWPILDDLVSAGIDGLNPLEVLAGMTVGAVREKYPRLFLTGGIDVSQLLTNGAPEEVRAACRQAIAEANGRGYFLGSSTEIHWDVPLENAKAMFETAWETAQD